MIFIALSLDIVSQCTFYDAYWTASSLSSSSFRWVDCVSSLYGEVNAVIKIVIETRTFFMKFSRNLTCHECVRKKNTKTISHLFRVYCIVKTYEMCEIIIICFVRNESRTKQFMAPRRYGVIKQVIGTFRRLSSFLANNLWAHRKCSTQTARLDDGRVRAESHFDNIW